MKTRHDYSLRDLNSFGVEASAKKAVWLEDMHDIRQLGAGAFDPGKDLVLGGGSNILFSADVAGTVYLNRIRGRRIVEDEGTAALVDVAAGENWHEFVLWSLDRDLCGLENLSLIPGLAGAAPMQNIGAYGVEISALMDSVEVYDWASGNISRIAASDCGFSYRDSRFKSSEPNRFLILSCRLRLPRNQAPDISYSGLAEELSAANISNPGARQVSDAVIRIRQRKLPDPAQLGNAGSFFKNPVLTESDAEVLRTRFNGMPVFESGNGFSKLSAAWMIEQCGWKGFREGDAGVSPNHALVLVNHGSASGMALLNLSRRIAKSVRERFGIDLEQEPKII
jgi:UDP-N-acetylmuramate dehydrogenase